MSLSERETGTERKKERKGSKFTKSLEKDEMKITRGERETENETGELFLLHFRCQLIALEVSDVTGKESKVRDGTIKEEREEVKPALDYFE